MATRWSQHMIEKMCDYRDQGMTEAKIADRLTLIFMRPFTDRSVNRKIRDLKKAGYIEKNKHGGRFTNSYGEKREGEKHERTTKIKSKTKRKRSRKPLRRCSGLWDGFTN